MKPVNRVAGVTLIELLVVVVIALSILTLVGGLTVESAERAKAETELTSFQSIVRSVSARAFVSGQITSLQLKGNSVVVNSGDEALKIVSFEYLTFESKTIRFSRTGMADHFRINITLNDAPRILDLSPIFEKFPLQKIK